MHFLTLAAVEIPPQEENLVENKWVEEQKKELLEKLGKNEKKDVFLQVMLQQLNHLSTPFSRTVDAAVAEQLEPFSVNTDDPYCLEFVDQTEELEQEYEGSVDCIRLPQGKIVPLCSGPYRDRFAIRDGKVVERNVGPAHQFRRTRRAKRMQALPCYLFRKVYKDFHQFAEKWVFAEWHEEQQAYGFYSNPNGQWDWYSIGGRWPCQLLVKESCAEHDPGEGVCGEENFPQPPEGYKWASAARMRDIQWEALREYYRALLAEQYAQLKEIFQTGALPQGFYGKLVEDGIRLGETLVFRKGESLEEYLIRTDRFRTRKYPMPVCNFVTWTATGRGKAPLDGTPVPRIGKPRWTTSSRSFPPRTCWWPWIVIFRKIHVSRQAYLSSSRADSRNHHLYFAGSAGT